MEVTKQTAVKVLNALKVIYPDAMSKSGLHITTGAHNYSLDILMPDFIGKGWVEEIKIKSGKMRAVYRWQPNSM